MASTVLSTGLDDDQDRMAEALAGMVRRPVGRVPPQANPASPMPVWQALQQMFVPHIADPATYGPRPAPSLQSAAPEAPSMGDVRPDQIVRAPMPTLPAEGVPQTAGKAPDPNRNVGAENFIADLGNIASQFIGGPETAAAGAAKALPAWMAAMRVGGRDAMRDALMAGSAHAIPAAAPSTAEVAAQAVREAAIPPPPGPPAMPQSQPILPGERRISTRRPDAVNATENPLTQHLGIGLQEMKASPGFEQNMALIPKYSGFGRLAGYEPERAAELYINQMADNLAYLYRNAPEIMRQRSPRWYEGAHEISDALARRWGVPRQSASGVLAALSPQQDWFVNASLGERLGDIMTSPAAGRILTPDMRRFAETQKFLGFGDLSDLTPRQLANVRENNELLQQITGKSLDQLETPQQKALWIRLHDQAHNPNHFRSITPEGDFGPFMRTQEGETAGLRWAGLGDVSKAVRAMESGGDMNIISALTGTKHKVPSFFNNIELPHDARFGDVTGDTHAVAASHLQPFSAAALPVKHHLADGGVSNSSVTGVQGTYGLVADANRRAAKELGLLPREAQSATWEPVRELFTRGWKSPKNVEKIDAIWKAYDRGEISLDKARSAVFDAAGGIGLPSWGRPDFSVHASPGGGGSTYR